MLCTLKNKKKKYTLSSFWQLFIKVIMVSSSHKQYFIYGQNVINSLIGTLMHAVAISWKYILAGNPNQE